MNIKKTYIDYNATAQSKPEVIKAMSRALSFPYNASSVHSFGREAGKLVEEARKKVAKLANAEGAQVIFTASGTEANNLAIKGFGDADYILVSAVEHVSVLMPAEEKRAVIIPVDENGIVKLDALRRIIENTEGKPLVSIMLANNETGVIQPIKEISEIVYSHGGYLHSDAVQAFGKIKVDFAGLNVDMLTISAHKFGGPLGSAALIIKKGIRLNAMQTGGRQEQGFRAGTQNVPAIVGFGVAAEKVKQITSDLRDYVEKEIKEYAPETLIFGENVERVSNTSCISLEGMTSETQLINFDLAGIAVSSGSACSSGKVDVSHVLLAMGLNKERAGTAIRISFGESSTKEDADRFIKIWKQNYDKTRYAKAA